MADGDPNSFLKSLLEAARPYSPAAETKGGPQAEPAARLDIPIGSDEQRLAEGVAVIGFLIEQGALNLGEYVAWNRSGIAFKNTYGDMGFEPWLKLSAAAANFEGEKRCREEWDNIRVRADDGQRLTIASYVAEAKELGWKPILKQNYKGKGPSAGGPAKNEDFAAFTVRLVEDAGDEFWSNREAQPHVSYKTDVGDGSTVKRHLPIKGSEYREVLQERFFDASEGNKILKDEQAASAAAILAMRAKKSGFRYETKLRVGGHDGSIYVDRGTLNGAAIEIDADDWREVTDPPVRFVRGSRGELPAPERGGTLADFQRHFNLNPDDLRRAVGFMIGTYASDGSYPLLITDGEQGSCKSTLNDKILGLTDPPHQAKSARMSFNPKEQDLHILAQGAHVLSFDNVSTLNGDGADMICRLNTGGASGSRELYSNDRYVQFVVIRPVMLSCIGVPSVRADLLDRSIRITAQPVERRLTEQAVQTAFERDRPKMLGFLFSCISAAIKNRSSVDEAIESGRLQLPRMADFAAFVEGAHELLGLPLGGFSALLQAGQGALQIESVTGDPVGAGLLRHFSQSQSTSLTASASDLLRILKGADPQEHRWPAANGLSKRLKRIAVGLRHIGVLYEIEEASGHDNVAMYRIWVTPSFQRASQGTFDGHDSGDGHF